MHTTNPERWTESKWLQQLTKRACPLTGCHDDATDLSLTCLHAFYDHFRHYPWQHADAHHAWRWCCQKLLSDMTHRNGLLNQI